MKISFKYLVIIVLFFALSQNRNSIIFEMEVKDTLLAGFSNFSWVDQILTENDHLKRFPEMPHTKIFVE